MKFTTGTKEIFTKTFTVKRSQDEDLEMDYTIEKGKRVGFDTNLRKAIYLYHNVSAKRIKIGETIYDRDGNYYGYRSE